MTTPGKIPPALVFTIDQELANLNVALAYWTAVIRERTAANRSDTAGFLVLMMALELHYGDDADTLRALLAAAIRRLAGDPEPRGDTQS